jgi:hypothetical protein
VNPFSTLNIHSNRIEEVVARLLAVHPLTVSDASDIFYLHLACFCSANFSFAPHKHRTSRQFFNSSNQFVFLLTPSTFHQNQHLRFLQVIMQFPQIFSLVLSLIGVSIALPNGLKGNARSDLAQRNTIIGGVNIQAFLISDMDVVTTVLPDNLTCNHTLSCTYIAF